MLPCSEMLMENILFSLYQTRFTRTGYCSFSDFPFIPRCAVCGTHERNTLSCNGRQSGRADEICAARYGGSSAIPYSAPGDKRPPSQRKPRFRHLLRDVRSCGAFLSCLLFSVFSFCSPAPGQNPESIRLHAVTAVTSRCSSLPSPLPEGPVSHMPPTRRG